MTKFLTLWKTDMTKAPDKPEELMALRTKFLNMIKEDFKSGDWGEYASGHEGYGISEGTEQEIALVLMKYSPYIKFKVYPVLSVEQELEIVKKLSQA